MIQEDNKNSSAIGHGTKFPRVPHCNSIFYSLIQIEQNAILGIHIFFYASDYSILNGNSNKSLFTLKKKAQNQIDNFQVTFEKTNIFLRVRRSKCFYPERD